jgi:hypothetical protein
VARDEGGVALRLDGVLWDITDRKRVEEGNERFRVGFEKGATPGPDCGVALRVRCQRRGDVQTGLDCLPTVPDGVSTKPEIPQNGERHGRRADHLTGAVRRVASRRGATAGQVALAWVLARGEDIAPIPGTKRRVYVEENVAAAAVELTSSDMAELEAAAPAGATSGPRYDTAFQALIDR